MRIAFAMPAELPANWIFRLTQLRAASEYDPAGNCTRSALLPYGLPLLSCFYAFGRAMRRSSILLYLRFSVRFLSVAEQRRILKRNPRVRVSP